MSCYPDFIIIGAMKCATSTLHDQLAQQPGIFMSTPKEPNFFSDDENYARGSDWYTTLFDAAEAKSICGESSTHYTKLPTYPRTVERMRRHLPDEVKFIYIMRDPIDRLISQYIHDWTERIVNSPIDLAVDERSELIDYSKYAMQLEPFEEAFGRERVLPVFFERLVESPQDEFQRIGNFIGVSAKPIWDTTRTNSNVSSERLRKSGWRDSVVDLSPVRYLRKLLVPKILRTRIRKWWAIPERPQLPEAIRIRLHDEFNQDLAIFSQWFGLNIQCSNFVAVARQTSPEWKVDAGVSAA